jgi:hypothetical protein
MSILRQKPVYRHDRSPGFDEQTESKVTLRDVLTTLAVLLGVALISALVLFAYSEPATPAQPLPWSESE